jgi:hypothetical protein
MDYLLNCMQNKADTLEKAGEFDKQILNWWQCVDECCCNHNLWCFVDYAGQHWAIHHSQQALWAKAIASGEADVSVEKPLEKLYNFWKSQGPITGNSKASIAVEERKEARQERVEQKDFMEEFMKFNQQVLQMWLQESMADSMEWMAV